jgi:hypothetical protein
MAPAGCELIDVQVVKILQNMITAYISINTHYVLGHTISQNTPSKNKLDASTLLLYVLRGLWGNMLRTILTYKKPQWWYYGYQHPL